VCGEHYATATPPENKKPRRCGGVLFLLSIFTAWKDFDTFVGADQDFFEKVRQIHP
jgi:hypothetical protein